jgi:hypothetical protein
MKMKRIRRSLLCFVLLLGVAPVLDAQTVDLSKYRDFSLGTSLTNVLNRTGQKLEDVTGLSKRPALLQQLTWWPANLPSTSLRRDPVEHIVFSFGNDVLYKISVTYERAATEGLTTDDMIKSLSARYGEAATVTSRIAQEPTDRYAVRLEPVAVWEDTQYAFRLVQSSFSDDFELMVTSKQLNAEADIATAEAVKLDEQERPQKDAERQKKETNDLESTPSRIRKAFVPDIQLQSEPRLCSLRNQF